MKEGAIMSKSYSSLREDLISTADDKEYRHAYAEEQLNLSIATQIKVLREQREMTQEELAEEAEMKQSMISRFEDVNYSSWSINTLRKLAKAFDVYLEVRFRSFREMVESVDNFRREALQIPSFTEDPYFKPLQPAAEPQPGTTVIPPAVIANVGMVSLDFFRGPFGHSHVGSAASAGVGSQLHETQAGWDPAKAA